MLDTVTYTYGDSTWSDLLTSFDGTSILYDSIGNPILIGYNTQLSWKGRQLISYCPDYYHRVDLTYNADGVRTSKTYTDPSGETRHEYILDGTQIVKETVFIDDDEAYCLVYLYDETGAPIGFRYRTPSYAQNVFDGYFFEKNLLGDIIGIWDQNGTKVVSYTYDAWGNVTASGTGETGIGAKNPFRYRGYYYDTETGLYYLHARYYDPEWCRFISPDNPETLISSETSLTDKNLFAYCDNNPIMRTDDGGEFWHILAGALIGAVVGAVTSVVTQVISGEDINWKAVGISAASGAISGAITAACPCMGPVATGIVQGSLSAATYAATEKFAYGRDPSLKDVIVTGVVSGVMAGGAKFLAQKAGVVQCFIAGTLVAAKSGLQPIETIQAGDYVWATDPETGQTELKQVVQTFKNEANELVHIKVNGEEISTTPGHPFWVPQKGWTKAIQLRAGDRLQLLNGEYVIVEQVQHELLEDPVIVYNFEVEGFHTYYVGTDSLLVHNKCNGNWSKGSFDSPDESAYQHFLKHRNEVGAHSVQQYTNKATSFANTVLTKRVGRTLVDGFTDNVYRYTHAGRYVDLVFDGVEHLIVSFGAV